MIGSRRLDVLNCGCTPFGVSRQSCSLVGAVARCFRLVGVEMPISPANASAVCWRMDGRGLPAEAAERQLAAVSRDQMGPAGNAVAVGVVRIGVRQNMASGMARPGRARSSAA